VRQTSCLLLVNLFTSVGEVVGDRKSRTSFFWIDRYVDQGFFEGKRAGVGESGEGTERVLERGLLRREDGRCGKEREDGIEDKKTVLTKDLQACVGGGGLRA